MNKIINWLGKEENQADMLLTSAFFIIFVFINIMISIWIKVGSESTNKSSWMHFFLFTLMTLIIYPLVILLIYFQVILTKREVSIKLVKNLKKENSKIYKKTKRI